MAIKQASMEDFDNPVLQKQGVLQRTDAQVAKAFGNSRLICDTAKTISIGLKVAGAVTATMAPPVGAAVIAIGEGLQKASELGTKRLQEAENAYREGKGYAEKLGNEAQGVLPYALKFAQFVDDATKNSKPGIVTRV